MENIAGRFAIEGRIIAVKPLGNGLINDTYKVETDGPDDYVLQRINTSIFKDPQMLQHNLECVTGHIRAKLLAAGESDIDRKVLRFLPVKEGGRTWWSDGKDYWRMSVFIRDAYTYEAVTPEYAEYAGRAFGRFEALLADLSEPIGESIPDFHNMELRASQLHDALREDRAGRLSDPAVKELADQLLAFEEEMTKAERLYREGKLPKRICHCDTKVNNILFDADGNILCVIDLDTVMPSFVFSDFGDFLRTAANFTAEDDPDLSKVGFNMEIYKAFAGGYLASAGGFLTPIEKENLPFAACLFPYMQCVRFFTDYLNGDTYYKIKYPTHNLDRSLNQWTLFQSARAHKAEMAKFGQN